MDLAGVMTERDMRYGVDYTLGEKSTTTPEALGLPADLFDATDGPNLYAEATGPGEVVTSASFTDSLADLRALADRIEKARAGAPPLPAPPSMADIVKRRYATGEFGSAHGGRAEA